MASEIFLVFAAEETLLSTSCAVNSMSFRAFTRFDTAFFLFVYIYAYIFTHQDVFSFNILHISKIRLIFAAENKLLRNMTTLQMNAELFRQLSIIAKDENLMARLLKYTRKLTAKMEDPTLMTKEEFYARVDEAKKGSSKSFTNVDELDKYIRAL